ncbi:MAG: hypothetical protein N3B13_03540, partial [Deltaproteobacteria bacterium]|nr:hypothetical protein [Deltaproteobacteria bacterium]
NISNDPNNCGKCERVCEVTANVSSVGCINSVCSVDYCIGGYTDLDKKYENGCEYKCRRVSDRELPSNMQDDDCDGFIDNICSYEVDSRTYNIASDLSGRVSGIFSVSDDKYTCAAFIESLLNKTSIMKLSVIEGSQKVLFVTDMKELSGDCSFGSVAMKLLGDYIDVFWTENCGDESRIMYNKISYNGIPVGETTELYKGTGPFTNLIVTRYKSAVYISFETTENGKKSVIFAEVDTLKPEMVSKRVISNKELDSYGHNIIIEDDNIYVSYCEVKNDGIEVVVMKNELFGNSQLRYPVYKTDRNVTGTAIGFGNGYFILMWTESETSVGAMYITVLNQEMISLILKKVNLNYDEFGLPVISYNGNIFGSAFQGVRNGKGYILFSDIDIGGNEISELIISPVSLIEKPYMSSDRSTFYVFYTDINSKMKYSLNMKRVYCREN